MKVDFCRIFDWASRIFDRSSTVALQVELHMCRILSINYVINVFLNITALVIGLKPISMTTHALTVTSHASKVLSFDSYFGVFLFFCSQQPRNFSGRFCFGHADSHCIYLVNKEVSKRETSL